MRSPTTKSSTGENGNVSTVRRALPQFIAVGVKNLVLFGYGMTLGFPTIVIPALKGGDGRVQDDALSLTDEQISWFSSINLLAVPLGCFLSGVLTEPLGKRRAMQFVNIPMLISWLLFFFATNIDHLYAGLILSGLSGGLMEAPVLTYVAEVTQPQFRGMLAATGTMCVITGIFIQFVMGAFMTWRTIAMACISLPALTILALCFVPESPYWLLTKGRVEEAGKSLAWLRGWVSFDVVQTEFNEIRDVLLNKKRESDELKKRPMIYRFLPYTRQSFLAPFALISATFFIGHFSGKTPLQTYAVQIFHTLKAPIDKYYATVFLGAAELLGAITCVFLVHLTGKRPLVFTSLIGCGLCFFGTATYAKYLGIVPGVSVNNVVANVSRLDPNDILTERNISYLLNSMSESNESNESLEYLTTTEFLTTLSAEIGYDHLHVAESNSIDYDSFIATNESSIDGSERIILPLPNAEKNQFLWLPLTLLLGSAWFAHMGIRLIPWMLIGEVFPVAVRSGGSGLSSGVGYIFGFLANKLFLTMLDGLTLPGTFWFYSAIALIGCVILYFVLPETEGKTLLEIEAHFVGKPKIMPELTERPMNGFDHITLSPPIIEVTQSSGSSRITLRLSSIDSTADDDKIQDRSIQMANSVPEVIVTTPRAGSKRFMKPSSESRRCSNASVNETTHL